MADKKRGWLTAMWCKYMAGRIRVWNSLGINKQLELCRLVGMLLLLHRVP
jgi:hypothetical protein